jgi:SAM-dependent methyltransferase
MSPHAPAFHLLFRAEGRHFWFRARNAVLERMVRRLTRDWAPGYRVLEVGCGNGNVLQMLERVCVGGEVTGAELYEQGVEYARRRVRCRVVQADLYHLPFSEPFHLVGMFDVLEHLPDDAGALQALREAISEEGRLIVSVPAYMALWSHTDEIAGHQRRYTPAQLHAVLTRSGWDVEYLSPFMMPLIPFLWLGRRLAAVCNRLRSHDRVVDQWTLATSELKVVPVVNQVLYGMLATERPWLAAGGRLPVGTSLLAIASPSRRRARAAA